MIVDNQALARHRGAPIAPRHPQAPLVDPALREDLDNYLEIWGTRDAGSVPVEIGLAAALLGLLAVLSPIL
mgnify:CR=1 FL=1